jgi:hypothetical protein
LGEVSQAVPFTLNTVKDVDDALNDLCQAWAVASPPTRETLARIRDRLLDTRLVLARDLPRPRSEPGDVGVE